MDWVIYLAGALIFFALVMASIALHEVGHLVPGKAFGVKTTQYFVGFGKTLWSKQVGETEYGFKAFPLGGATPRRSGRTRPAPFEGSLTAPARPSGKTSSPPTTAGCSIRRSRGRS
jgi:hypothetical protein